MSSLIPIPTLHLFPVLDRLLIEMLRSLSPSDWQKPTVAKLWTVKDVAAHLLDGNMRAISAMHNHSGKPPQNINSYPDLVSYLNRLNAVWVEAMDRVSPEQITDMLEATGPEYYQYLSSLDPFAPALYPVAWAGEEQSLNWFHIAREYTEKWHHQQQIRHAIGSNILLTRELFYPCITTFIQALPYNYRYVDAPYGTVININITGDVWYLHKHESGWRLIENFDNGATTTITIKPEAAWQMFTKALSPQQVQQHSLIEGNILLAQQFFSSIAVMA
ncbi:maleylpyruvate isomerase N-terminal domain-containing protein [Mucilaginibacter sp. UR6-1]|uniref:maleylpyruvate isomerase family mycothiol-dependent enzyme n=1 Tax=Mucilaginibacter sp. UR6-1 TaxID=1435643 RepID=UPI001E30D03C|nr:maleylpyruvate isomerase family mycothiol-dependent enzyme [Mucilaginibacter sp. UR6-1]MCC8407936.1 maleylpyruvate isomerase N-terminal domain-containing protein [Mucilaginibacter sp. UR6-1]